MPDLDVYRDRLRTLSGRPLDCLALLADGFPPKRIAALLGIGTDQVYKHLARARTHLGGIERSEMVRLFAAFRAEEASFPSPQLSAPQSLGLSPALETGSPVLTDHLTALGHADDGLASGKQEIHILTELGSALQALVPLRSARRQDNDLDARKIMTIFVLLTIAALIVAGSAISLLMVLDRFARP